MTTTHHSRTTRQAEKPAPGTPMELFGSQPGVSVIDPATVLTRLWYFDGKFLRAEGFRLDQEYVRSLVALSNQAVGAGVVHGLDVRLAGSDALRIEGGLALAPSGRVVYLPGASTQLSIATLISRSRGSFDPGEASRPGVADFTACSPEEVAAPEQPVPPRPLYVLTAAPADALCGEEERFGRLCEDACASDTDRSVAVEGVRFRVREVSLVLPHSRAVPFHALHLRSRVAAAYYAAERGAMPSMVSGAGLRGPVWCRGAEGISGDEVPLAVLDRAGSVTSFVDMWTARRELLEPTPARYWQWRSAMRPLDVFWAQVLQFQCQLLADPVVGGPDDEGPCADHRRALATVDDVLRTLRGAPEPRGLTPERPEVEPGDLAGGARIAGVVGDLSPKIAARLDELRGLVSGTLARHPDSSRGSLLLDQGIVETPSAGYLPVDPDEDVRSQVRAWLGPGVDLRFCVVRPDFVPEAQQEAQHMERISLTRGIDVPGDLEEVDVLVPGAEVGSAGAAVGVFRGEVAIFPGQRTGDDGATQGSAVQLSVVARERTGQGWSWTAAGQGEMPQRLGVETLATALLTPRAPAPEGASVHLDPAAEHARVLSDPGFLMRAAREASLARERRARAEHAVASGERIDVADAPVAASDRRPISAWIDGQTSESLSGLPEGAETSLRLRGTVYSRASTNPVLHDLRLVGTARVRARAVLASGTGAQQTLTVTTSITGTLDQLSVSGDRVEASGPQAIDELTLVWRFVASTAGTRLLSVEGGDPGDRAGAEFVERGSPRRIAGSVGTETRGPNDLATGAWKPVTQILAGLEVRQVARVSMLEEPGALDSGEPGRDLATAAIDVLGAALAVYQRDEGFEVAARSRLLDGLATGPEETIRARAEWVMFHRRRTKRCVGDATDRPAAVRRFRWFHAVRPEEDGRVLGAADLARWAGAAGDEGGGGAARFWARLDRLGFEPVTTVTFAESALDPSTAVAALRAAWSAAERGPRLVSGIVATQGGGEGVRVERGRMSALLGTVGDLVDASRVPIDVLDELPPDFRSDGLHGVFLTTGVAPAVVPATDGASLVRLGKQAFARVSAALKDLDSLRDILVLAERLDDRAPVGVARFDGKELVNGDEVKAWLEDGQVASATLVLDRDLAPEPNESWRIDRTPALARFLGLREVALPDGVSLHLDGAEALYLVQEARR